MAKEQQQVNDLQEKLIAVNRVSKTVKGAVESWVTALTVVGDGRSCRFRLRQSLWSTCCDSKSNGKSVVTWLLLLNEGTLTTRWKVVIRALVYMQPAAEGTGVIAGGAMRAVLEAAGVHNVLLAHCLTNPINIVRATIGA